MRIGTLAVAMAALLGSASAASATVLVQTESYGPTATNWGTPTLVSLSFPGFNSSLGTLTGIVITATETNAGTTNTKNNSTTSSSTNTVRVTNTYTVNLPSVLGGKTSLTGSVIGSTAVTLTPLASSGVINLTAATGSASATWATGNSFSPYESAFVITAKDLGSGTLSASNGNGSFTLADAGEISVTIDYTYTGAVIPVPEPGTLTLLSTGALALGLTRRRRRQT